MYITRILMIGILATFLLAGLGTSAYAKAKIKAKFSTQALGQGLKAPCTVRFVNESKGEIESCLWGFGDGSISTEQSPMHTYNDPGRYTVTLKVRGPEGESIKRHTVAVKAATGYVLRRGGTKTPVAMQKER